MVNMGLQRFKKHATIVMVFIILNIVICVCSIIMPLLESQIIDMLSVGTEFTNIICIGFYLASVGLAQVVTKYFRELVYYKISSTMQIEVCVEIVDHIHKVPLMKMQKYAPGYIAQRIETDSRSLTFFWIDHFYSIWENGAICIVTFIIIGKTDVIFASLILFMAPLYFLIYILLRKRLYQRRVSLIESQSILYNKLNDQFQYLQQIKTEAAFEKSHQSLRNTFTSYLASVLGFFRVAATVESLNQVIKIFFKIAIYLIGGALIITGKGFTVGQFVLVISYFNMIISALHYYLKVGEQYQNAKASYDRIMEFIHMPIEHNGTAQIEDIGYVKVNQLTFGYPQSDGLTSNLFRNLSIDFQKDQIYVIKGTNGCGKSTLINILLGLYQELDYGYVQYGDLDIKQIDLYTVRRKTISVVPQHLNYPPCFVREILGISDKEHLEILLCEKDLQDIYQTDDFNVLNILDQNIVSLSGGQLQKIAILQVLMKNPTILIMDEPTSAIDQRSIIPLLNMLQTLKKGRIVIIVSHDPSVINFADEIVELGSQN